MIIKDILNEEQKQLVANIIVDIEKKDKEIERLNNIIKEVREYTELFRGCLDYDKDIRAVRLCKDILEILDKGE